MLAQLKRVRNVGFFLLYCIFVQGIFAQNRDVVWQFRILPKKDKYQVGEEITLLLEAEIKKGFHLFSAIPSNGGYRPTEFQLEQGEAKGIQLLGRLEEKGELLAHYDELMEDTLRYYKKKVVFQQRFRIVSSPVRIRGFLTYQYCTDDEGKCFFPTEEIDITLPVSQKHSSVSLQNEKAVEKDEGKVGNETIQSMNVEEKAQTTTDSFLSSQPEALTSGAKDQIKRDGAEKQSLLWFFLKAFLFGLAAIFTPCVFPIIPMTISFFTKMSSDRKRGLRNALVYAFSILAIFVVGGLLISFFVGATGMYKLASNPWLNLVFFVIIFLFGLSFLGLFEITLPSRWATALDRQAERGGLLGIFFMAVTLVLVSFSCTGPLVGTILIDAASGKVLYPLVGMTGFGLAFALPFGLFAIFPTYLSALPRSGSWLNTVKVTLGFLELALALKFLSNADLVWHTRILDREIYLTFWIVIFSMLGFYLLGKLRLPGDEPVQVISVPRLLASMVVFSFVVYMIPGLWGAPLKMLSGFLPPVNPDMGVVILDASRGPILSSSSKSDETLSLASVCELPRKYADKLAIHTPPGFCAFYDLAEAQRYSEKVKKPILIDFTGHTCVNCRQVESNVWSHPMIRDYMSEHFVLVSLYVDEAKPLPQPIKTSSGKTLRTVGDYWLYLQDSLFHTQAQPYYVIVDHNLNVLGEPQAYTLSIDEYKAFLEKGLQAYRQLRENSKIGASTQGS